MADVFHDRLTVKSKYSNPLVAWRFHIDAAMAPWRMVFYRGNAVEEKERFWDQLERTHGLAIHAEPEANRTEKP